MLPTINVSLIWNWIEPWIIHDGVNTQNQKRCMTSQWGSSPCTYLKGQVRGLSPELLVNLWTPCLFSRCPRCLRVDRFIPIATVDRKRLHGIILRLWYFFLYKLCLWACILLHFYWLKNITDLLLPVKKLYNIVNGATLGRSVNYVLNVPLDIRLGFHNGLVLAVFGASFTQKVRWLFIIINIL